MDKKRRKTAKDRNVDLATFNRILLDAKLPEGKHSFPIDFALSRFEKKLESPDQSRNLERRKACWDSWLAFDENLLVKVPFEGFWYKVRHEVHTHLKRYRDGNVEFTPGETFYSSRGCVSLAAKLAGKWTCTVDNFDAFAKLCYETHMLKKCAKVKIKSEVAPSDLHKIYENISSFGFKPDAAFLSFKWGLGHIVHIERGSRFSTVPKNNEKDRPINIECFANTLTQRVIGNGLRAVLSGMNNDLNQGQDTHRKRIKDSSLSTIDLSNASDSLSLELVEFLCPPYFFKKLMETRSDMVLSPTGDSYHITNKISSMGNGFTFELMTLVLLCICRVLDQDATVYGDDIIIKNDVAHELIKRLTSVGFEINKEKSFIHSPFRESCGSNYHDDHGYIESYDFKYCQNIGDAIITMNKLYRMRHLHHFFDEIFEEGVKCFDKSLLAQAPMELSREFGINSYDFPHWIPGKVSNKSSRNFGSRYDVLSMKRDLCAKKVDFFKSVTFVEKERIQFYKPKVYKTKWFKINGRWIVFDRQGPLSGNVVIPSNWVFTFASFIYGGRVTADTIRGHGQWVTKILALVDGRVVNPADYLKARI